MRKQEKNNPPHLCQRRQRRTRLTVRTGGPEGEDISRKRPHRAQPGGFLSIKKEECSTKIRIYRHAGHTRFGFFANRNERSPGGGIDGFGEKSENRPKKANENAEGSAQNAGFSAKSLRFFPESSPLLLRTRRPSDPKASENECTLPTMGGEMPTTPRPSRDFIGRHRRNEESHPTF